MAYKAPNPISKIKISGEDDCIPSELNEINLASGANVNLSTDYDTNTITISSTAGPTSLSELSDITIVNPQNGEVLVYDDGTGKWINSIAVGSLPDGDAPGQMLVWDRILPIHITYKQFEVDNARSTLSEKYDDLKAYADEVRPGGWLPEGIFKVASGAKFAIRVVEAPGDDRFELFVEDMTNTESAIKGNRHTVRFNFVDAGDLSVSRDNVGYENFLIAGIYPDHYADTKLITITIPPETTASDIVSEINNAGFPDIEAETLVDGPLSSELDSQLEQGLGLSDLAYYQQSQPDLSNVWHIGDLSLKNYETKVKFFGSEPNAYMYTVNVGNLGYRPNIIKIQPGAQYYAENKFGGDLHLGVGDHPFLKIETSEANDSNFVDSNLSVRLLQTEAELDPNVSLFWETTDAPGSGEQGVSGRLTIKIKLNSANFNDIHNAFHEVYSNWFANPDHTSPNTPDGNPGGKWQKFFKPSFDNGASTTSRAVSIGFTTVESAGNPIYTEALLSSTTSAYATQQISGQEPQAQSVFVANPEKDITWTLNIFPSGDGVSFAVWDDKTIEHGDFPFSISYTTEAFASDSRRDELNQYSDNFYRTWDQRKSEYNQMVDLVGGVPDFASMTVEQASSPLFYGWRKLTPVMNGGYPVWDINWRIVHSSETSLVDSEAIDTIPADDITPGDDFVRITTTSGSTTLESQDSDVSVLAPNGKITLDSNVTLDLVSDGSANLISRQSGILIETRGETGKIIIDSEGDEVDIKSRLDMLLDSSEKFNIEAHKLINVESQTGDIQLISTEENIGITAAKNVNISAGDDVLMDWNDGRTIRFYDNGSQVKIKSDDSDIIIGSTNGKAYFYAEDDLSIESDDGKVIIDGYFGFDIDSDQGGMDVNVAKTLQLFSSEEDVKILASQDALLRSISGNVDIRSDDLITLDALSGIDIDSEEGGMDVNVAKKLQLFSREDNINILARNDLLLMAITGNVDIRSDDLLTLEAGSTIKLDTDQDIVLDSATGVWDFKEDGVSQLQITTSPKSNDVFFASTNPYGKIYFGIDSNFPVDEGTGEPIDPNIRGLMINLTGYDDTGDGVVDGYFGQVGVNFQDSDGKPTNLFDILATRNDQGFQVSTPKFDQNGARNGNRALLKFTKENDLYGRLQIYKEDGTAAVDIGARPGHKHYFHANGATRFAIGTKVPKTLLHIANDSNPYITMQNTTEENGDGQCETQLRFADHDANTLAYIEGSHDGTDDDSKGKLRFLVNDGTNTWNDAIVIGHAGDVKKIGQSVPSEGDVLTWDNHHQRAIWSDSLADGYIEELQDVDFGAAGPANGDALVYDASTETWRNSPISGSGGGAQVTTVGGQSFDHFNGVWSQLSAKQPGLTNGVVWNTGIQIPAGATVIDVIVEIVTPFNNMGSYDTVVTWQPGLNTFAFSGFYDSSGYFSSYYGSKILGNDGIATTNGSWTNNTGLAQSLELNFHHEVNWRTPIAPTSGSMTVSVRYLS